MMKYAINAYGIATGGGTLAYQKMRRRPRKPTRLWTPGWRRPVTADANDFIYQWETSHDFNPTPPLDKSRRPCS